MLILCAQLAVASAYTAYLTHSRPPCCTRRHWCRYCSTVRAPLCSSMLLRPWQRCADSRNTAEPWQMREQGPAWLRWQAIPMLRMRCWHRTPCSGCQQHEEVLLHLYYVYTDQLPTAYNSAKLAVHAHAKSVACSHYESRPATGALSASIITFSNTYRHTTCNVSLSADG